ncbi:MAG: hypothetical protein HY270_14805 [Deltaproteobacteria bacterium]|nr:hypothetical protein [Deltaproteobacteria bacterium]
MVQTRRVAAAVVAAVAMASSAQAISTSDRPAAIQVWPKVVVDSAGRFTQGVPVNTLITLSNTDHRGEKRAHCFYTNANGHCANNSAQVCRSATDCTASECTPGWAEMDFDVYLTLEQPLGWYASDGLSRGAFPKEGPFFCNAPLTQVPCTTDAVCGGLGCNVGQSNLGSGIPPVPEDPFIGTLTCIQFTIGSQSSPDQTVDRNRLYGEATILQGGPVIGAAPLPVDVAKYNAVGFRGQGVNFDPTNTFQLGGAGAEYDGCASTLILSHLFDGAIDPISNTRPASTDLTLVPCGNNFSSQIPGRTTAQFLVFNEFEQRFSTSRSIDCLFDGAISTIDTRNTARSIFSAGVAGTISGQTRIRGVGGNATGYGLIGTAQLSLGSGSSAAYNLHQQGVGGTDFIIIP